MGINISGTLVSEVEIYSLRYMVLRVAAVMFIVDSYTINGNT